MKKNIGEIEKVMKLVKDENVKMVDFKFMDFPGLWQHFSVPVGEFTENSFEDGHGFDGSSIRGWKTIHESDMLIIPDPETAVIDPFSTFKTMSIICDVYEPLTKEKYGRCPRNIAQKAEAYLKSTGVADTAYYGPEAEFFILDDVRFDTNEHSSYYYVDSNEGRWNSGREEKPNLGYKPRYKEGYFPSRRPMQPSRYAMQWLRTSCQSDYILRLHIMKSQRRVRLKLISDMHRL